MSTEYIAETTAETSGADFTLAAGASRAFWCQPALGSSETVNLFIKNSTNSSYTRVGVVCSSGEQTGVVTAQGTGSSVFQARKSATTIAKGVYFD